MNRKNIHRIASQSRWHSFIEALINIGSGFILAFLVSQGAATYEEQIQLYIWSGFKWDISVESNLIMTSVLTMVSITRSLIWRRVFNYFHIKRVCKDYSRR